MVSWGAGFRHKRLGFVVGFWVDRDLMGFKCDLAVRRSC